jgi:hypothetical protein
MQNLNKKQLIKMVNNMAIDIIFWQNQFNKAKQELESLDGKKRLGVLIESEERIIESNMNKLHPIKEGD